MGVIFERPPLARAEVVVEGQTLTLYQFTADVYYDHLMTVDAVMLVRRKEAGEIDQSPNPDDDYGTEAGAREFLTGVRNRKDYDLTLVACALAPGYPEMTVDALRAELRASLSVNLLRELASRAEELNGLRFPKASAQVDDSSAG
tara:strand:- start:14831 stop:15265 length:435 start_codon:yes stop_codon:yes gene_type:complete